MFLDIFFWPKPRTAAQFLQILMMLISFFHSLSFVCSSCWFILGVHCPLFTHLIIYSFMHQLWLWIVHAYLHVCLRLALALWPVSLGLWVTTLTLWMQNSTHTLCLMVTHTHTLGSNYWVTWGSSPIIIHVGYSLACNCLKVLMALLYEQFMLKRSQTVKMSSHISKKNILSVK